MWPDDSGDWGGLATVEGWVDPTGTTAQNGPQVQANDVLTQSTVSHGPDRWGGYFASLLDKGVTYALQRDAAKNGLIPATSPGGQPVYRAAATAPATVAGMTQGAWLFIGGAVVAGVLLAAIAGQKG